MPGMTYDDLMIPSYVVGDVSFGSFWSELAYDKIITLIENGDEHSLEILSDIQIIDDNKKIQSLDTFLSYLTTLNIKRR